MALTHRYYHPNNIIKSLKLIAKSFPAYNDKTNALIENLKLLEFEAKNASIDSNILKSLLIQKQEWQAQLDALLDSTEDLHEKR